MDLQDLLYAVTKLGNNYTRLTDQVLRERLSVTYAQFSVLDCIRRGANNASILSGQLGKTEASISRQVHILQAKGLLERNNNEDDDRYKILSLTDQGFDSVNTCYKVIDSFFATKILSNKKAMKVTNQLVEIDKNLSKF